MEYRNGSNGYGGRTSRGNCYKCGRAGHWARNCYAGRRGGGQGGRY